MNRNESRVIDLEKRLKPKPSVHDRLDEFERTIAHYPPKQYHQKMREFYMSCSNAELEELIGLGPNPPRWQIEALAHGATRVEVLNAASEEKMAAETRQKCKARMNFKVIQEEGK